ncbi:hypothetical protein P154DRAFT_601275, partial [Amniculicola lignicola CBS 123094]
MSTNPKSGTHRKESKTHRSRTKSPEPKGNLDRLPTTHTRGRSRQEREFTYADLPQLSTRYMLGLSSEPFKRDKSKDPRYRSRSRARSRSRSRHHAPPDGWSNRNMVQDILSSTVPRDGKKPLPRAPGHPVEWFASDGRKGALAKQAIAVRNRSRHRHALNAENLAKVPSEKINKKTPSTAAIATRNPTSGAKSNVSAKSASKASAKPTSKSGNNGWGGGGSKNGFGNAANNGNTGNDWAGGNNNGPGGDGWNTKNDSGGDSWNKGNNSGGGGWGSNNDTGGNGWTSNGDAGKNDTGSGGWDTSGDAGKTNTGSNGWNTYHSTVRNGWGNNFYTDNTHNDASWSNND